MSLDLRLPAVQVPPIPAFSQTFVLDGTTYTLAFQWEDTSSAWYLSILDEPGQVTLMARCAIVADWPLYRSRRARTPPGLLICLDTSGQGIPPGLSDLGARCVLSYVPASQLGGL